MHEWRSYRRVELFAARFIELNSIKRLNVVVGIKFKPNVPTIRVDTSNGCGARANTVVEHQFTTIRVRANQVLEKSDRLLCGVNC